MISVYAKELTTVPKWSAERITNQHLYSPSHSAFIVTLPELRGLGRGDSITTLLAKKFGRFISDV